jgi:tagatose-6-phosphate ketose/aldose isomerase
MTLASSLQALRALSAEAAAALGVTHTLSEILHQPRMWLETFEQVRAASAEIAQFLQRTGMHGPTAREVVLIGAGSSDFVAHLVAPAFRARYRVGVQALATTDLLTQAAALLLPERRHLFVWFSRSGTTPEALELLPLLERLLPDSQHLFITCNAQGQLAAHAPSARSFGLTLHDACNDRGLAMTSSFTCMTLAGLLVALEPQELGAVQELASAAERVFEHAAADLAGLARSGSSSACMLGSGPLKAAAAECALKLTELSAGRVKTRHDSFLGVRHGPLASLDRDTAVVGLLSRSGAERMYELELVREIREKSLAGAILLVAPEHDAQARQLADVYVNLGLTAGVPELLRPLLDVTVGQLLALFASLAHGVRPDAPSPNGAIARVVANIRPQASDGRSAADAR